MRLWVRCALALVLAAGCGPKTTCEIPPPSVGDGQLRADGTVFRDTLGRQVFLRGVNVGGRSKFAPYAPFDFAGGSFQPALDAYLDRAQSWGIDFARVPFTWEAVEPTQGTDDADFLSRYDALLDGLWKRGIRTVVDFHQDVYAQMYCGDGFPAWTVPGTHPAPHHDCPGWGGEYLTDPDVAAAFDRFWAPGSTVQTSYAALWDRVATRYAARPGVVGFELFNEPGWGTSTVNDWEANVLPPFFTSMAARVHALAPDRLVFFEGPGSDGITATTNLSRPDGDGLVFAPHYYQLAVNLGTIASDLGHWAARGRGWKVPVVVGEFGVDADDPQAVAALQAHWDALEALGLGGAEWEYSVSTEAWNAEHLGLVEADGGENVTVAPLVRAYVRALAGSDLKVTRGPGGEVSWQYSATGGVTEVVAPARLASGGWEVQVTGACVDQRQPGLMLVKADADGASVRLSLTPR